MPETTTTTNGGGGGKFSSSQATPTPPSASTTPVDMPEINHPPGTGASRVFQILYRNEEVTLKDVILFRAHLLGESLPLPLCVGFVAVVPLMPIGS